MFRVSPANEVEYVAQVGLLPPVRLIVLAPAPELFTIFPVAANTTTGVLPVPVADELIWLSSVMLLPRIESG